MTLGKESSAVEEWALGGRGIQDTFRLPVFPELCWCFYFVESAGCDLTVNALTCVEKAFYLPRLGSRCQDLSRHRRICGPPCS